MFVFLRRFALRIPDEKLASQTRIVMWGFVGAYAMLIVAGVEAALTLGVTATLGMAPGAMFGTAGAPAVLALGVFGCGGGVAAYVFGIWYIVLLSRYHVAFREATTFARQLLTAPGTVPPHPGSPPPLPPSAD